jgi:hypothetical protein
LIFLIQKACDSNEPFKAVNRFDVYEHLSTMHGKASEVDEEELDKLMYRPHDLRKIVCLECGDYKALENAQWLCRYKLHALKSLAELQPGPTRMGPLSGMV